MALKGKTKLELFDAKTGELIQTVEKHNMLTNYMSKVFQPVPVAFPTSAFECVTTFNIAEMTGGIMLFEDSLNEDPNDLYQPESKMVAHASKNTDYDSTDLSLGTFNSLLSSKEEHKVVNVWDWDNERGNGQISALGLTTKSGGLCGCGSVYKTNLSSHFSKAIRILSPNYYIYLYDLETNYTYSVGDLLFVSLDNTDGRNSYVVTFVGSGFNNGKMNLFYADLGFPNINLFDNLPKHINAGGNPTQYHKRLGKGYTHYEQKSFDFTSIMTGNNVYFCVSDGKIWVSMSSSTATWNHGTSRTFAVIDLKDFTYQTKTVLNNLGVAITAPTAYNHNHGIFSNIAVAYGRMFVRGTDKCIYAIDLQNNTDVVKLKNPDESDFVTSDCTTQIFSFNHFGRPIFGTGSKGVGSTDANDAQNINPIQIDSNLKTKYLQSSANVNMNNVSYYNGSGLSSDPFYVPIAYTTGNGYIMLNFAVAINCLTTINNLETPVEKTSDMTMRITYTITDSEFEEE